MFQSVILQIVVPFVFSEFQMLPLDQEPLTSILAAEIDKQVGGKVYENQLMRKGAQYFTVKSYDFPEAVDNEILFTVQCEASAFFPICSPEVVYQMKVVEVFAATREVRCEWPDPLTGVLSMMAMIEVDDEAHTELPALHSLIQVELLDYTFEFDNDHVKCIGKMVKVT